MPWRPSVPSSPFTFFFLYSLNPRRGDSKASQNCDQVSRRRRAFHRKAGRSPSWAPERLRLWWTGLSAVPRGAKNRSLLSPGLAARR